MAELAVAERRDLIASYVDNAKINWAHIGIAQLMKHGYVDRVLTTNFDLLAARACALVGLFPAVYDFATSQLYKPADIPDEAIIHLHGQRTGFVLMNTEDECKKHSKRMAPVFRDAGLGRVWLVVAHIVGKRLGLEASLYHETCDSRRQNESPYPSIDSSECLTVSDGLRFARSVLHCEV